MERAAWTDERLDDLAESIRTGFARSDQDIRDLRGEFGELRAEMRTEFAALREEIRGETGSLRAEVDALRLTIFRVVGAGFLGIIAAILARGG
ncbi:MAG TPA: hypothetical protein VKA41_00760 [Solirubrobacterales bacterium]|nr:hypothetical protein [Solirubrobacterales bacterium]